MAISVYNVFSLNRAIENLIKQDINLSFKCGFQFYRLKKELDEIERYTVDRLNKVINTEHLNNNTLTNDEESIYLAVMNSMVELDTDKIDLEELKTNSELKAGLKDIMFIYEILSEKNNTTLIEN